MNDLIPADYNATIEIITHTAASWLTTLIIIVALWMICRRIIRWIIRNE